ncbi:MAG: hypothetical protein L0Z55_08435, partial [Planctomycetes bacterium]|nr:hypothetical protein [Planctomycetota bacterium]
MKITTMKTANLAERLPAAPAPRTAARRESFGELLAGARPEASAGRKPPANAPRERTPASGAEDAALEQNGERSEAAATQASDSGAEHGSTAAPARDEVAPEADEIAAPATLVGIAATGGVSPSTADAELAAAIASEANAAALPARSTAAAPGAFAGGGDLSVEEAPLGRSANLSQPSGASSAPDLAATAAAAANTARADGTASTAS